MEEQPKQAWWQKISISGISLPVYAGLFVLLIIILQLNLLPNNIIGALFALWLIGNLLYYIGANLPFFKTYLGGGAVFCLFAAALLTTFGIIPHTMVEASENFISEMGFMNLFIISLITASILGMDRKLLLKAAVRFMPVALTSIALAVTAVGLMGIVVGMGFHQAVMYVGFPMTVGGVGAGIIPLSQIYSSALGDSAANQLSLLFPAGMLANLLAIITAAVSSRVFADTKIDGHGELMPGVEAGPADKKAIDLSNLKILGVGLMMALSFYMFGTLLNSFIPKINTYAFIILGVIAVKASGKMPVYYEQAAITFGNAITKNLTSTMLAGVGISMLDLRVLLAALNVPFVILCVTSIVVISLSAGFLGKLFGLYPLESAISGGLVNDSMGGAGNIAVLAASNRMNLIAFAQMGNRIGGAIMLVVAGLYVSFFG